MQLTVEAGFCTLANEYCNVRNCENYCNSLPTDGNISWYCDDYNLCTCTYNIDNSKHKQRCSITLGSCNGGKPECDAKCEVQYRDREPDGICFDYPNGIKMCVCTYAS